VIANVFCDPPEPLAVMIRRRRLINVEDRFFQACVVHCFQTLL
jgi:hypothetical protein